MPIRELSSQGNQLNGIPKTNKPLHGDTRLRNGCAFGNTWEKMVVTVKEGKKIRAKMLLDS